MQRLIGFLSFVALLAVALPAGNVFAECRQCIAQSIFDEDAATDTEVVDKPAESEDTEKVKTPSKAKKKKKARKKRKQAAQSAPSITESEALTPQELARQSYVWAPESTLRLKSTAPGIKNNEAPVPVKAAAPMGAEALGPPVQPQDFKLPQIPLGQVLIVAGFVILFLIYRFRVGRQLKRRKY